jgi:4-hydroxy-4-methyl-2-oxoglutarate aldolase
MNKPTPLTTLIQQLTEFDTALLANTIGYVDPTPAHEWYMGSSIKSTNPSLGPTCGVAVTAELDTSSPNNPSDTKLWWELLEIIQKTAEPVVLVVKTVGSRPDHECVMGDGMGKMLNSVGCNALVTNGGVRDVVGLNTVPFVAYCSGITIHHCALRWTKIQGPVEVGGITVKPGDIIHANNEGVIKLPSGPALANLPEKAIAMRGFEHKTHMLWRQPGATLEEKKIGVMQYLKDYGFSK